MLTEEQNKRLQALAAMAPHEEETPKVSAPTAMPADKAARLKELEAMDPASPDTEGGQVKSLVQHGLKLMDYPAGLLRATVANNPITRLAIAMHGGKAPSPNEAMQNLASAANPLSTYTGPSLGDTAGAMGIPAGPNIPGTEISTRSAVGAIPDILLSHKLSPQIVAGLLGLGSKAAPTVAGGIANLGRAIGGGADEGIQSAGATGVGGKLIGAAAKINEWSPETAGSAEKLANATRNISEPVGSLLQKGGRAAYDSSFKKLAMSAADEGKDPQKVLDFAWENNLGGTLKTRAAKIEDQIAQSQDAQKGLYLKGDYLGAGPHFDPTNTVQSAEARLADMKKGGTTNPTTISNLEDMTNNVGLADRRQKLSEWADINKGLYKQTRGKYGSEDWSDKINILKAIGHDRAREAERAASFVSPGLGSDIHNVNQKLSMLYSMAPAAEAAASKGSGLVTKGDLGVAGAGALLGELGSMGGIGHGPMAAAAGALGTKATMDALRSTWMKTRAGKLAYEMGGIPMLDATIRRSAVGTWGNMDKGDSK